jgi:hypothetical protein
MASAVAEKPLIFVIPSGLQAARDLLFRLFSSQKILAAR